ncbi:ras-domain-containing protein [Wolfiporia cocos MD-104 SS10]|uniref:Ras-domain-containing protein n=1 Tax=Wolfiporia cocos (strain MD-104) TaxID=742152 RepID=A0A2H3IUB3_WOLCO|nr:ras-domain-containing protein [Wolfiporia cocos MD-104 SS10]
MRTVKVVVIGSSGVGKTSLRNQYISGRFTTGYRATIGADFITKTVPHHSSPEDSVTLQIWDTAGQERFSSLSSAFFRGADAVLLLFDVNQPDTLQALTRWWSDFREKAPVPDDEVEDFCVAVVGNKVDLLDSAATDGSRVTETDALHLMDQLVPPSSPPLLPPIIDIQTLPETVPEDGYAEDILSTSIARADISPTKSIDILARHHRRSVSKSRSTSRSTLFRGGTLGTMTTTHTIYHTPSSSFLDAFESALSSPAHTARSSLMSMPSSTSLASSPRSPRSPSYSPSRTRVPRRQPSGSSISTAPTITPSLFARDLSHRAGAPTMPASSTSFRTPPTPERGPQLFFTSAKTGVGVADVFAYVARRVVMRWEYEEALDARTLHVQDGSADDATIRLDHDKRRGVGTCCGS